MKKTIQCQLVYLSVMGKRKQKKIQKAKHPYHYTPEIPSFFHQSAYQLEIKPSQISGAGSGVYTQESISKGSYIDAYTGTYYRYPMSAYFVEVRPEYGIDAGNYPRCYMAMMNDVFQSSFEVNCEFRVTDDKVSVYAIRDIVKGEELFVSYGDSYWY